MPCLLLRPLLAAIPLALVWAAPALAQNAQALNTRALAATCANCHGTEGKAVPGASRAAAGRPAARPTSASRCRPSSAASARPR